MKCSWYKRANDTIGCDRESDCVVLYTGSNAVREKMPVCEKCMWDTQEYFAPGTFRVIELL